MFCNRQITVVLVKICSSNIFLIPESTPDIPLISYTIYKGLGRDFYQFCEQSSSRIQVETKKEKLAQRVFLFKMCIFPLQFVYQNTGLSIFEIYNPHVIPLFIIFSHEMQPFYLETFTRNKCVKFHQVDNQPLPSIFH